MEDIKEFKRIEMRLAMAVSRLDRRIDKIHRKDHDAYQYLLSELVEISLDLVECSKMVEKKRLAIS